MNNIFINQIEQVISKELHINSVLKDKLANDVKENLDYNCPDYSIDDITNKCDVKDKNFNKRKYQKLMKGIHPDKNITCPNISNSMTRLCNSLKNPTSFDDWKNTGEIKDELRTLLFEYKSKNALDMKTEKERKKAEDDRLKTVEKSMMKEQMEMKKFKDDRKKAEEELKKITKEAMKKEIDTENKAEEERKKAIEEARKKEAENRRKAEEEARNKSDKARLKAEKAIKSAVRDSKSKEEAIMKAEEAKKKEWMK